MEEQKKQKHESHSLTAEFIPYESALELKELGFDEPCNTCYDKLQMVSSYGKNVFDYKNYNTSGYVVSRPTFSQAFRFFREQLLLDSCIIPYWFIDGEYKVKKYTYSIEPSNRFDEYFDCDSDQYDTYEEARLECLKKLIEIAKEQNVK